MTSNDLQVVLFVRMSPASIGDSKSETAASVADVAAAAAVVDFVVGAFATSEDEKCIVYICFRLVVALWRRRKRKRVFQV